MDTRELIRKLYDENADVAELEKGLDDESREELTRLVEAKETMLGLAKRGPSAASIDAVLAYAEKSTEGKRPRLSLILGSPVIQRFAVAAAVVIAVGLGYLTFQPIEFSGEADQQIAADEAPAVVAPERRSQSTEMMDTEPTLAEAEESAPALELDRQLAEATRNESPTARFDDALDSASTLGLVAEASVAGRSAEFPVDDSASFGWEDDRDIQTFYWQMQALSERSPDDEWEEGVPLEGSFDAIQGGRRNPGWLEANSER